MAPLYLTSMCLLAMTFSVMSSQGLIATPPVTNKPRMIHRPVPGTTSKPTPAASKAKPSVQATQPRRVTVPPAQTAETATDETRILQIIRQGTPGIPPTNPAQTTTDAPRVTQVPQRESETPSSAGRVRILTQAEAEALAAQSR